jgi:hypothetical protein
VKSFLWTVVNRRDAKGAEKKCFSLAVERPAREKLRILLRNWIDNGY